ncbi:MAG: hypothetical protein ACLQBX_15040 [Candidatus Limnocylindrales bacterium]|jgi:hypothetical protein
MPKPPPSFVAPLAAPMLSTKERDAGSATPDGAGSLAAADAVVPHVRWVIASANMVVGVAADHLLGWKLIADGHPFRSAPR